MLKAPTLFSAYLPPFINQRATVKALCNLCNVQLLVIFYPFRHIIAKSLLYRRFNKIFFSSIQVLFLKYNYSHYIKEGYELKKMDKDLFGNEVTLATQITWRLAFDQGKPDYFGRPGCFLKLIKVLKELEIPHQCWFGTDKGIRLFYSHTWVNQEWFHSSKYHSANRKMNVNRRRTKLENLILWNALCTSQVWHFLFSVLKKGKQICFHWFSFVPPTAQESVWHSKCRFSMNCIYAYTSLVQKS